MIERNFDIYIFHVQTCIIDLYKPLTARCESARDFEKCEKSKAVQERTRQTDGEDKRLGTFARLFEPCSCLEPLRVSLQAPPSRHAPSSAHCRTQKPCAFAKNPENRSPQKTPPQTPEQRCRRKVNTVSTGTQHPVVPKSAQKTRKNPREPLPAITINTS